MAATSRKDPKDANAIAIAMEALWLEPESLRKTRWTTEVMTRLAPTHLGYLTCVISNTVKLIVDGTRWFRVKVPVCWPQDKLS